ncbi:MAG: PKD domain-containing protein, partial [Bacteriovorax sp.]
TSSTNSTLDYNFHSGGDFTISLSVKDSYGGVGTVSKTVTVKDNNPPLANFTCTNTGVQTIHCESTSSDSDGLIASTSWVLDDGSNLSGTSFDHTFLNDQPHAVNLIITDDLGANATATQSIQVIKNQLPTFDITTDVMSGTLPLTVNFQAINVVDVDGTIASYSWDFGDATNPQTANTNSTSHTFTKAGTYNVKLSVTDNNNGVMTKSVTIATSSAINFVVTSDVETGYVPLKVHFDASQSTSPDSSIASLEWFYKGASIGSGAVLDHTFTDIGSLKVDLVATDAFGVKSSTSKIITTTDEPLKYPPEAFFNIYESDTLVDLHAAITRTQFDIKRAYYTIDGNQTVELSEFYPNTINEVDLKTFGEHQIDLTVEDVRGQKATFTHKFTQTQDLSVLAPYTDFSAVQSSVRTVFLYFNRTFNFDEFRGIKSFHIDYGNGETEDTANLYTTHTYPVAGTYQITVKAISSYNTEKSMTHEVTITNDDVAILSPIANFSYRIYDVAQNVSFYNDRSATPNGSIISYLWDFGDGESATGQKVAHFYNPGSYFVTLTVTDSAGLRSSQTQHVVIYQAGTDLAVGIDCSYTKPFVEYTQQCKLFALDKQNQISKVRVIWGDGTANNLSNPQVPEQGQYQANHKFAAVGTYPISLSVLTSRGETKTANTNVTLTNYAPPVVASLYCNVNNLLVSCNALGSYGSAGSPLTYTFDYGDSFTETNTTGISTHAYSSAGLFTVSLKVINGKGEQATAQTQVQTLVPPNQLPIPNLYCYSRAPYILNCNAANSNDFDGTITSFQYAWDDNTNEIQAVSGEISHAFVNGGNHQVILTVTDNDGGVSSVTNSYYVQENHPPVAAIYCSNTGTMKIHCDSNSQDFDFGDLIKEYKWDLGDGHVFTTTLPSIDYTYLKEGTYGISLMVSDSFGATDSTSQYITPQNLPPVANFNCFANGPLSLNCYNDSYDPEGMMMVTEWFVDGEPIQVENSYPFKLSFSNGGVRLISQKLTDVFGAVTTKYQYFTVDENIAPLVNIVCNPSAGYTYQCSSNASDPDGTIVESLWTIDGKTFSGADILYDITNGGDKIITFTAKDNLGKVTTQSITIHVDRPEGILSCTKLSNYKVKCDASASVGKAGSSQLDYKIYFGDDYLVNSQVGEYEFQSSGDKIVKLVIADDLGNKAQTEVIINIAPMHTLPVPFFIEQVELGRIVNFDASKSLLQDRVVLKYEWDFGDGSKEVTAVPKISHSFQENTYYLVTLKITDENGDLASFSKQLFVYDPQVLDPGEQGRVDLMGIDSDNDGIRDDVQRWIQFESKDNLSMRKYLRTIALVYEENFRNLTTLSNISNNFSKLNKLEQCLKLVEPDPVKVDFDNRIFRVAYGNTDLRFNALNAINASFAGKAIDGDMTDSDLKLFCEALP